MPETRISLVRHGEVHNPDQIFYGRLPRFSLTPKGRAQAEAVARALRDNPTTALYTSPLLRARQTAMILRKELGMMPLHCAQLLTEVGSPYDGQSTQALAARRWDLYSGSPGGFEQPLDILRRACRFLALTRSRYAGSQVIAVTHGDLISILVLWARSAPITPAAIGDLTSWGFPVDYPRTGTITDLRFTSSDPSELPLIQHHPEP